MATIDPAAGNQRLISITLGRCLQSEYGKLLAIVGETNDILMKLERRRLNGEGDPEMWLKGIKELYYQADEVLDELSFEDKRLRQMEIQTDMIRNLSICFLGPSHSLLFGLRMSCKIKGFRHVLDELKRRMPILDSTEVEERVRERNDLLRQQFAAGTSADNIACGRDDKDKNEIINLLIGTNNEEMLPVIAIVGAMGIGKTTLAKAIYNDPKVQSHFDVKRWGWVSKEFKVKLTLHGIVESLTGRSMPLGQTFGDLWDMLDKNLSGKKFLIVMDDVWKVDEEIWKKFITSLSSTGSSTGSKIIVTTRSDQVASITGTLHTHHLGLRSPEERRAHENAGIVRKIAVECGVGGSPTSSSTTKGKEKAPPDPLPEGIGDRMLGLCYDKLESPLKRCLAYCTLFSPDCITEKKELIQLWMAEGFLGEEKEEASSPNDGVLKLEDKGKRKEEASSSNNGVVKLEDTGNAYFEALKPWFFLEFVSRDDKGEKEEASSSNTGNAYFEASKPRDDKADEPLHCRLHDVVRAFALKMTVLGNEVKTVDIEPPPQSGSEVKTVDNEPPTHGDTQSLSHSDTQSVSEVKTVDNEPQSGSEVKTVDNKPTPHSGTQSLSHSDTQPVPEVKTVDNEPARYLSMLHSDTQSVSDEFYGKMKKVRTCLIGCRNDISTDRLLSNFQSLRVLKLRHVSNDHLPSSIGELIHLRYLDLSHGRFKALPASISRLLNLQTLKLLRCRYLQSLPKGMENLIKLRHLEIERNLDIPRGNLRQLRSLQTFTSFKVGNNVTQAGIEELGCLQQLEGRLSLIGLNNVKDETAAEAANLKNKGKLQELELEWESDWHVRTEGESGEQDGVLKGLQVPPNLLFLRILRFSGTEFPDWLNGSSPLSNIQQLEICSCHHVRSLDMKGLRSLRKLIISYCENLEYARVEGLQLLELLEFKGCDQLKSLLTDIANQEEQVGSSQGKQVHKIPPILPKLEKLRIESCDHLAILPEEEMLLLKKLKILHLGNSANQMVSTRKGLENLSSLQHLDIENYSNLEALPKGIGSLSSLQRVAIRECPKLDSLPEEMEHWTSLQQLSIFACANLRDLPKGIAKLVKLEELEINGCDCFISFPEELKNLNSLKMLKIEQCSSLRSLPVGLGNLSSLQVLEISRCKRLTSLPGGMIQSLDTLRIHDCDNLKELPELGHPSLTSPNQKLKAPIGGVENVRPSMLRLLDIIGCPNLRRLPEGLGNLQKLSLLEITDCSNLEVLPEGLGKLSSLRRLYIRKCINLRSFPQNVKQMTSLGVLWLIGCPELTDLSNGLRNLTTLEKLAIWGCHKLVDLSPGIQGLKSLRELTISHCSNLETLLDGLESLTALEKLAIWECHKLVDLSPGGKGIKDLKSLRELTISHNLQTELKSSETKAGRRSSDALTAPGSHALPAKGVETLLEGLENLTALENLAISGCHNLVHLSPRIQGLKSLRELTISHCSDLKALVDRLENLTSLQELVIWKCPNLTISEQVIQELRRRNLSKLSIKDCARLETIDDERSSNDAS